MRRILLVAAATTFVWIAGCQQAELEQRLQKLRTENAQLRKVAAQQELDDKSSKGSRLVHVVWFKLKPELSEDDRKELIDEIEKLNQIECVNDLEVGKFAELGDLRAMKEFQLVMDMNFGSEQEYHEYQAHPIHLALKEAVGKYLAGPPVSYDYWTVLD